MRYVILDHLFDKHVWKFGGIQLTRCQLILLWKDNTLWKRQTEKSAIKVIWMASFTSVFVFKIANWHLFETLTYLEMVYSDRTIFKGHFARKNSFFIFLMQNTPVNLSRPLNTPLCDCTVNHQLPHLLQPTRFWDFCLKRVKIHQNMQISTNLNDLIEATPKNLYTK